MNTQPKAVTEQGFNIHTKGVYPIAATPFHLDLSVDWESLDRLTDFYEASGATGITILGILGVLGEAGKLAPEESREIAGRVIRRTRLPIVVGFPTPALRQWSDWRRSRWISVRPAS
ncbi:dihydrodipicolinate synthase family protein [Paracoccus actinidiae]|uniref:dihydrodipicolinate synthase family protein n=1 Tax=Paracoccus actinidiae TaxID=3064531 RepID=UPI0027D2A7A1|nr:hypothetical protein [Paracoccus sp. M09]